MHKSYPNYKLIPILIFLVIFKSMDRAMNWNIYQRLDVIWDHAIPPLTL